MSPFVLDTDILTLYSRNNPQVSHRIDAHSKAELAITVITVINVEEQMTGWYNYVRQAKRPQHIARGYYELAETIRFLAGWQILLYTEPIMARYSQLCSLKLNVGKMDLKIAAIVLENGGIVVIRNVRDFQRVPGLVIENWAI